MRWRSSGLRQQRSRLQANGLESNGTEAAAVRPGYHGCCVNLGRLGLNVKSLCSPLKNRHCKINWTSRSQGKVSSSRGRSKWFFFQVSASQLVAWGTREQRPNAASSFPSAGGRQAGSQGSVPHCRQCWASTLRKRRHRLPSSPGSENTGFWPALTRDTSDTTCVGVPLLPPSLPPLNKSPSSPDSVHFSHHLPEQDCRHTYTSDWVVINRGFPWPPSRVQSLLEWLTELRKTLHLRLPVYCKGFNS